MRFLTILFLKFSLFSNFLLAETMPNDSKIFKQSSECIKGSQRNVCRELLFEIELTFIK